MNYVVDIHIRLGNEAAEKLKELKEVSGLTGTDVINKLILDKPLPLTMKANPEWVQSLMQGFRYMNNNLNRLTIISQKTDSTNSVELISYIKTIKETMTEIRNAVVKKEF